MSGTIVTSQNQNLRKHFANSLIELAKKDKRIILLAIDLGYSFFEEFARKYPKQFINTGVIEQSAIDIACGLAIGGMKPYVYSASNFLIFRALEQIRNDVAYQNLNVKLVGFAGVSYNFLGYSHLPGDKEDVKILKRFLNIKIYEPKTEKAVKEIVEKENKRKGPAYIRLV